MTSSKNPFYAQKVKLKDKDWLIGWGLFFASLLLFAINLEYPKSFSFDEFHYVPSAKQYLELRENQNWEHPPLGKILMAAGIGIFGDNSIGWRAMSCLFGALTLAGTYSLGLALFGQSAIALWATLLTLCNHLLYVQARIGMLDTFMYGFLVWALALFCFSLNGAPRKKVFLTGAGICFGFAIACKWFALMLWLACLGLIGVARIFQKWKVRFEDPKDEDWYTTDLWKDFTRLDLFMSLGVAPFLSYAICFIPVFLSEGEHTSIQDFFSMQYRMWDGQLRVVNSHPYMSNWTSWALLKRPIWYAFEKDGTQWARGVVLLGNPLVMWSGLIAVIACFHGWIMRRERVAFLIAYFYSVSYFCWMIIPRKVAFYYYYYPAGMLLSYAIAYVFHYYDKSNKEKSAAKWVYLLASFFVFAYFFPILSGARLSGDAFRKWMWFSSWI